VQSWQAILTAVGASAVVAAFVSGGVAIWVGRRESRDRQDALALDRERWEHLRSQPAREHRDDVYRETLEVLRAVRQRALDPVHFEVKSFLDLAQIGLELPSAIARLEAVAAPEVVGCFLAFSTMYREYLPVMHDIGPKTISAVGEWSPPNPDEIMALGEYKRLFGAVTICERVLTQALAEP
jgi:hypothetical protein